MLSLLLALALTQAPPLQRPRPALRVHPTSSGGLPITGAGECTGATVLGSYGEAVTFTRATAHSCTRSDGTVVMLTSGQPATTQGALKVRPAVTNAALRSEAFDTTWTLFGAIADGGVADSMKPTLTASDGGVEFTDPKGTFTAYKLEFPATVWEGDATLIRQAITGTAAAWSAGTYMRTGSGTATVYQYTQTGASAPPTNGLATCSLTTAWSRCKWENATLTVAAYNHSIGVDLRATIGTGQAAQAASTVYVWGATAKAGAYLNDYCGPTAAAAVTCNGETATIANPLAAAPANPAQWCACGTHRPDAAWASMPSISTVISTGINASDNWVVYVPTTGRVTIDVRDAASAQKLATLSAAAGAALTASVHQICGCSVDGTLSVWVDGYKPEQTSSGAGTGIVGTQRASVFLGSWGASLYSNGSVSDLKVTRGVSP